MNELYKKKSNIPVDVIVTFNVCGKIRPIYIRLENDERMLETYKIVEILYKKEERYAGISVLVFSCNIEVHGIKENINIKYYPNTHQWLLTY